MIRNIYIKIKQRKLIFFFFISLISIKGISQNTVSLENIFLKQFISDYKSDQLYFKGDTLYVLVNYGEYKNFVEDGINVIFLNQKEVKEIVIKNGKFNLIEMSNFLTDGKLIKTEFIFLIALNEKDADFAESDNTNVNYCIKFNCLKNEYESFMCD